MNRSVSKIIVRTAIAMMLVMPTMVAAAAPTGPSNCTPGAANCTYLPLTTIPGAFKENTPADPVAIVKNIYGVSISIAAVLAVGMIIWAGVEYATAEAIGKKTDAKEKWQGAIVGLLLLLSSYIILRTINVSLVDVNLDLGNPLKGVLTTSAALNQLVSDATSASTAFQASEQQAEQQIQAAQTQIDTLQSQKTALQAQLASAQTDADKASINQQIAEIQNQIVAQQNAINNANAVVVKQSAATVQQISTSITNVANQTLSHPDQVSPTQAIAQIQNAENQVSAAVAQGSKTGTDQVAAENLVVQSQAAQQIAIIRAANSLGDSNQTINTQTAYNNAVSAILGVNSQIPSIASYPDAIQQLQTAQQANLATLKQLYSKNQCNGGLVTILNNTLSCSN
ncbi:MAG: hypothetical protein KGH68_03025 [Patescibacteria group bacterium]|nr:hypothetical protein [Patescibacteria group bacterium]